MKYTPAICIFAILIVQGSCMNPGQKEAGARNKRESGFEGIQSLLSNANNQVRSFMSDTSSSMMQQVRKLGESFGDKGKEIAGQVEQQVKKFQEEASKKLSNIN